jgi:hypothetical protein
MLRWPPEGASEGEVRVMKWARHSPISHTLSLNPADCTLLMLKPWVGVMCEISSDAITLSKVV